MQREKVASKLISEVGYDPQGQVLEISFHSGATYKYFSVSPEEAQAFMKAESLGSHFLREVKGKYDYRKVEPDEAEVNVE